MKLTRTLLIAVMSAALPLTVHAQDVESMSIGQRFHFETSFGYDGSKTLDPRWGADIPLFKTYDDAAKTELPEGTPIEMSVDEAIGKRRSVRTFADRPLPLAHVARVLHSAYGITQTRGGVGHRGVPSGGGLYPIEIYLIASHVDTLEPGVYHFQPSDSSLERVLEGDYSLGVYEAANQQDAVNSQPALLVIAARFDRSTWKYSDRGYRYVYIEAGAVCQSIYLQATALGLGTCAVGAFNDDALSALLEVDGIDEAPLLVMPLGFPKAN
jgi:SagB-type dehydrogenase family enzyme